MEKPSFSIIVPVYNVEEYIIECLESVAAQDYDGPAECIIVDDRGKDRSIELAQDFIDKYTGNIHFKIIVREHNGGLSAARNTGIRAAKGEYITFLDSDDMLTPNCLSTFAEYAAKYPDAQIIQGLAIRTDNDNVFGWYQDFKFDEVQYFDNREDAISTYLQYDFFVPAWSKVIKSSFIKDNNLYYRDGILLEDNYWQLCALSHLTCLLYVNVEAYIYRIRQLSIMKDLGKQSKRLDSLMESIQLCESQMWSPISMDSKRLYLKRYVLIYHRDCRSNEALFDRLKDFLTDYYNKRKHCTKLRDRIYSWIYIHCHTLTPSKNPFVKVRNVLSYQITNRIIDKLNF